MSDEPLRCPEEACTGWVSEVDDGDEHFWGCGECGNVWYERAELDEAIAEIIVRFPYRKKVYRQSNGNWQPVPLDDEPEDYEELVEEEWDDE
jgi:Zn-finger nucleic acid-binding protein